MANTLSEQTATPDEIQIPVANLLIDFENPRLPDVQENQRDAIRSMVGAQGEKIIALAQHLVNHGPNPANSLIVMPSQDLSGAYSVLDGNRRVVAIKILENPDLAEGMLKGSADRQLRQLSREYHSEPIDEVSCVVFGSRDEADTWIQLIHRGENRGAGLVAWDGQVAARYDARKGRKSFELQVLDFVKRKAKLSKTTRSRIEQGKFPITTLRRVLNTPYVRHKLGIDKEGSEVVTSYPEDEILPGLTKVVEDIGDQRITVSDVKLRHQRFDYIDSFIAEELPNPANELGTPRSLEEPTTDDEEEEDQEKEKKKKTSRARKRKALIPRSCVLDIDDRRIRAIYHELKRLSVKDFPNATAVMLRVFVELSLDHYLENVRSWSEQQIRGSNLAQKLHVAANDMQQNGLLTKSQLAPIRKAEAGQTGLVSSVTTMHNYVHNRYFNPVPSELRTAWDDLQLFVEKVWESTQS